MDEIVDGARRNNLIKVPNLAKYKAWHTVVWFQIFRIHRQKLFDYYPKALPDVFVDIAQ